MADIFLSYSHKDRDFVENLARSLSGRWEVWWDNYIQPAHHFDRAIETELRQCNCVVVLWSRFSVDSDWVLEEAYEGKRRQILVPVRIDSTELPFGYRRLETIDLSDWQGSEGVELQALYDAIEINLGERNSSERSLELDSRYRVGSVLFENIRLCVELAWDLRLERDVTISRCTTSAAVAEDARALALASNHQQLTRVHDVLVDGSTLYIVADYPGAKRLNGLLLDSLLVKLQLFDEVCEAVAHLHSFGLAHGNIQPNAIALDATDSAVLGCLLPWSIQPFFEETNVYTAPELRVSGLNTLDVSLQTRQSADFYALGGLLANLLTGADPSASIADLNLAENMSDIIQQLCCDLLHTDPDARLVEFAAVRARLADAMRNPLHTIAVNESVQQEVQDSFFGRESTIRQAMTQLERVRHEKPGILLVEGAPGAGKSRTLDSWEGEYIRQGANVLRTHAIDGINMPFAPIAQLLRQYTSAFNEAGATLQQWVKGDLSSLDDHNDYRQLLLNGIAALLTRFAARNTTVFMLDDFHWADRATQDLILTLAAGAATQKKLSLLIVLSTRSDADSNELEKLARGNSTVHIDLPPLPIDACAALIRESVTIPPSNQMTTAIFEMSRGNPLFVKELCRHLQSMELVVDRNGYLFINEDAFRAQLPPSIKRLLSARVDKLPADVKNLLAIQSCFFDKVSLQELVSVTELNELEVLEILEVGLEAGVLENLPGPAFQFTHPLFRQVVYTGSSSIKRQTLHAKIANALVKTASDQTVLIADHLIRAESFADQELLAAYAEQAGNELLGRYAWQEAVRFYEVCLAPDLHSAYSDQHRATLHHSAGIAAGKFDIGADRSRWHYDEALALYTKSGDVIGRANALRELLRWQFLFRERDKAIGDATFEQLEELLPQVKAQNASLYGHALETMATHLILQNDIQGAMVLTEEAASVAESTEDHELKSNLTESSFLTHLAQMEVTQARDALVDGLEAARHRQQWYWQTQWSIRLPLTHFALGELDECQSVINRTHMLNKDVPITDHVLALGVELSLHSMRGEFERALQIGEEVLERLRLSSYFWPVPSAILSLCQIHAYRGDFDGAHEQLNLLRVPGLVHNPRTYDSFVGRAEQLINRYQSGALFKPAEDGGPRSNFPNDFNRLASLGVRAQLADERGMVAVESVIEALRKAKSQGVVIVQGWNVLLDRLIGTNLIALGRWDEAAQHITQAAEFAISNDLGPEYNLCKLIRLTFPQTSVHDLEGRKLEQEAQLAFAKLGMYFPKQRSENT